MESFDGRRYLNKQRDINIKDLWDVIKKRIWLIVVVTLIAAGAGAYHSYSNNTPLYQSSARIIIGATPELRNTFQVIIKDPTVLEKVASTLNLDVSTDTLAEKITVTSVDNTQVVSITVTDTEPNRAAKIANTTAKVFKEQIPTIMDFKDVRPLSDAKVNPWPINQSQNTTVYIAAVIGIIVGLGLVFLLESFDDTLRTNREVEAVLELPVLGRISKASRKKLSKKYENQVKLETRGETIGYK